MRTAKHIHSKVFDDFPFFFLRSDAPINHSKTMESINKNLREYTDTAIDNER